MDELQTAEVVLLVDDDPILRKIIKGSLKKSGFDIVEAVNGKEAIAVFNEKHPDIVLLDVEMPIMDGFLTCETIRNLPNGQYIPLVMATGLDADDAVNRAYEVGATDFITKPFNLALLSHRLRYILRSARLLKDLNESKTRLATAQRIAQMGNWDWHLKNNAFHCSEELCKIFGETPEKLPKTYDAFLELIHPDDCPEVKHNIQSALKEKISCNMEYRLSLKNGITRIVHNQAEITLDSHGNVSRMFGMIQDITERKQAEQREARLGRILNASSNELLVFRADTFRIVEANKGARQNLGYHMEELRELNIFNLMPELTAEYFDSLIQPLQNKNKDQITIESSHRRKDGSRYPAELRLQLVQTETPPVFFAVVQDISERKKADEKIRNLAYYDPLTHLPNRGLFQEYLNQAIQGAKRNHKNVATLFIDLDRFKKINDTLGHSVGDQLLKEVGNRLKSCIRASDNISCLGEKAASGVVSRFGGDEFLILLSDMNKAESASVVSKRILLAFNVPFETHNHDFRITPSIGISVYPEDGEDAESLIKNADTAMYHAKAKGRNNFQFYTNSMNVKSLEKLNLEADLRKALEKNQLILHYQPQVDIQTGKIVGTEALLRWKHPDQGMIPPNEFIPLAEETGLILPIGDWVFSTACAQQKMWSDLGFDAIQVSINLSFHQLRQHTFIQTIHDILNTTKPNPERLELELTESVIMQNAEETIRLLNNIKEMGIKLSVDDFGTGYSSLSYLKRFPIDTLKIDRSFVRDIVSDPDDAAIVKAIIAMANSLNLKVIAEGVETAQQLEFLRQHGCHEMQGYYFSEPLTAEALTQLLTREKDDSKHLNEPT